MKMVQINAVYQYGSTGRNVTETHLSFLKKGHESYVFCTNKSDEANGIYRIGNKLDYKLHALGSRLCGLQGYFSNSAHKKLSANLDKLKPDVVILHNLHANYINLSGLLTYLADNNIATIIVLHDCWFFTGHCCHYTEDHCEKWQHECHRCPILHKYNKSLFFDRSLKIFNDKKRLFGNIKRLGVVGVSDWITNESRKSFLSSATVLRRIYNWIDLKTFYPQPTEQLRSQLGLSERHFVILGVAQSWNNAKGLHLFKTVAIQSPDIKVVMIGELSEQETLPSNVLAVGTVNEVRLLAQYYAMADVFLNLSIQETFGKVSAEALASGTPLIANDATATPEIVGDCGVVIHNNDLQELFLAIEIVRFKGKAYYSNKCVDRARQLFDKEKNIMKYMELCNELINT